MRKILITVCIVVTMCVVFGLWARYHARNVADDYMKPLIQQGWRCTGNRFGFGGGIHHPTCGWVFSYGPNGDIMCFPPYAVVTWNGKLVPTSSTDRKTVDEILRKYEIFVQTRSTNSAPSSEKL